MQARAVRWAIGTVAACLMAVSLSLDVLARGSPRPPRRAVEKRTAAAKKQRAKVNSATPAALEEPANKEPGSYEQDTLLLRRAYLLRDHALNQLISGNYGEAVKLLSEAAELTGRYYGKPSPLEGQLYMELGAAYESAGQIEEARRCYLSSAERLPALAAPRLRLAALLARAGRGDEAVSQARLATSLDPADARGHLILGHLLKLGGLPQEATVEKELSAALLNARPLTPARQQPQATPKAPKAGDGKSDALDEAPELEEAPLGLP